MPITAGSLFSAADLTELLEREVTEGQATVAERVVWGWLSPILNLEEPPAPLSPFLDGAALELGAIAVENPAGLDEAQLGEERQRFSSKRRNEILAAVASGGLAPAPSSSSGGPRGRFPKVRGYPDPVLYGPQAT